MLRYLIKRSLIAVITLLMISITTFWLFFAGSANPAAQMCGAKACDAAKIERINKSLGLKDPIHEQYGRFMSGIFTGREIGEGADAIKCPAPCLGVSFRTSEPVLDIIERGLPVSASIAVGSAVISVLLGVSLGIASALKRGGWLDKFSIGFALTGASLQIFFLGLLLQMVLVYQLKIWDRPRYVPPSEDFLGWLSGMSLPWVTLGVLSAATYARFARAEMLEILSEDFVRTARAKGLTPRAVNIKHALRASLSSIVTIFGLQLGGLLGGAAITETTFDMPGIGKLAVKAVGDDNLPIVMATVLLAAFFVVLFNVIVDAMYAVIDPRVKLS
ncbi:ABC transporter permease [Longispora albida]|uniref:ABC transporter permease n=1 Tax=Longispora albida TaxID=203523 RepID=UPI00036F98CC|nr:ABC transporter permease [Longispora albida]